MDFNKLLQKASSNVDKFKEAIEKESATSYAKDSEEYWQPTVDKAGNGYAEIRFLPTPPQDGEEGLPWVKYWNHGFKGPTGQWYIELSLTTLGKDDPVSEYNSKLWSTGLEANKDIVRKQKRKLTYVSNILVIKDHGNPANNGKQFKFKYGKKIFEKVDEAMNPQKYDEHTKKEGFDPFHFIEGATFLLKIRNKDDFRNYDKSEFEAPSPLFGGDATKLKAVWEAEYSLKDIVSPDKFKDYATLKQRLDRVLGIDTAGSSGVESAPTSAAPVVRAATAEGIDLGDDTDPDLFANLAKD